MSIVELDENNIEKYITLIDPDIAESIGREYYQGIVALDDDKTPLSALVWEYKDLNDTAPTRSEICCLCGDDKDSVSLMLEEYDRRTKEKEIKESFFETHGLEEAVAGVLKEHHFTIEEGEGRDVLLTVDDFRVLSYPNRRVPEYVIGIDEVLELQFWQGVTNFLFHGQKGLLEDLDILPKEYFESCSSCIVTDGKINGMLLVHRFPSGKLMPVFYSAIGADSPKNLAYMALSTIRRMLASYPGDTKVIIRRDNRAVEALRGRFFPGQKGETVLKGRRA